jgi:hypothetical protein
MLNAHDKGDGLLASRYRALAVILVGIALAIVGMQAAKAGEPADLKTLVVLPFEIQDTSGEVGPADRHDALLARLTALVRNEIASRQLYRVEPQSRTDSAVAAVNPSTFLRNCNGCEIEIAKGLRADCVLIGWIYKMSTLILALHIEVKDVMTSKTIYARVFDFRGDNEEAYAHAAKVLVRSLVDELPVRSNATQKDR